jgi:hypothetical protein
MFKLLLVAFLAAGAFYFFVARNRKMKFEVELEMDPVTSDRD